MAPSEDQRERRLEELARHLDARGVEAEALRILQQELDAVEGAPPPSLQDRMARVAKQQWERVMAEYEESKELAQLLKRRVQDGEELNAEESAKVREQMLDLMRMVPASLLAVGSLSIPVPGVAVVTPWMLARLGLMPSRWREAHMLERLGKEAAALRERGHVVEAGMVEKLSAVLADEADARERAAHRAELLSHWDANQDGKWDREERVAYAEELVHVREQADHHRR